MLAIRIRKKLFSLLEMQGECPILTGEIAVSFNKGLMGFAKLNDTKLEYGIYKVSPVLR